jgi:hypothetical protein
MVGTLPCCQGFYIGKVGPNLVGPRLDCAAMSGSRGPHLERRNGIYHLRVRVPNDVRLRVDLLEVRRLYGPTTYAMLELSQPCTWLGLEERLQ